MLGIIGGSGLYDMSDFDVTREEPVDTPYGRPSDAYRVGRLAGREVCFLARHGRGHRLLPSELNHRANIFGFKVLGVERIVSVTAVGSLRETYRPRDMLFPDQYFDRTRSTPAHTFFGDGIVAHIAFGEPVCSGLRDGVHAAAQRVVDANPDYRDRQLHRGGTYVNMEGPAFSTRAESEFYRRMGFDVVGMTSLGEAKLSREAEICYAPMALITDYDCWHDAVEAVSAASVLETIRANTQFANDVLKAVAAKPTPTRSCACGNALQGALMTDLRTVPPERLEPLAPILGKYTS